MLIYAQSPVQTLLQICKHNPNFFIAFTNDKNGPTEEINPDTSGPQGR